MKRNGSVRRVRVSADGEGVVSHAGLGMLRELAGYTGLVGALNEALVDTYKGPWVHAPGRVLTDIAVAVADGADAITGIEVLGDREGGFGAVASMPTAWRVLDRVDEDHLPAVRAARALAGRRAWAAGADPDLGEELCLDFDATITIAHSEENAAATWKRTFGFHPLLAFLDRPEIAGGEALAGLLRKGNAGSNTAADHVTVLQMALAALPAPGPAPLWGPCLPAGAGPLGLRRRDAHLRHRVPDGRGGVLLILRKERPHPGAQVTFTDVDGMRITAFLTDTPPGVVRGQLAGLELRHRQHARVEDRIRQAKAPDFGTCPTGRSTRIRPGSRSF